MDHIVLRKIDGCNRESIPEKGETIATDFTELFVDTEVFNSITSVDIYYRTTQDCPFGRGNWIADISIGNNCFCIKLPRQMKREEVFQYFEPLILALEKIKQKKAH